MSTNFILLLPLSKEKGEILLGRRILLVGLGTLGSSVLDVLSHTPTITEGLDEIVVADANEDMGIRRTNMALMKAQQLGFHPNVRFVRMNLLDIDKTSEQLREISPDLVYTSVVLQPLWIYPYLPKQIQDKIYEAGGSVFLPMNLPLVYSLMQALRKARLKPFVVNASFPDMTAPVLNRIGLGYTVGVGNIDMVVPLMKWAVSERFKVPVSDVTVFMVGTYFVYVSIFHVGHTRGAPYFLKVLVRDKDVTAEFDKDRRLSRENFGFPLLPSGVPYPLTVASSINVIRGLLFDTKEIIHAPGPNGLPGGYPVRVSAKGAEVVLPEDITLDEAIRINSEALKYDGVKEIKEDGTTIFTEKARRIIEETIGYDCCPFKPEESLERARELGGKLRALGEKHNLPDFALKAIWLG